MSHAADLRHAEFKAGLVAAKIVADQFATPVLQEVANMLAGAANRAPACRELRLGTVGRFFSRHNSY